MDTFQEPLASVTPPPPPPPQNSRRGVWIGVAVGVIVLCFCCIAIAIGLYAFKDQIPAVGRLFPTATPPGLLYSNPSAGFNLWYPQDWVYADEGDSSGYFIMFASSQRVLEDTENTPQDGAVLVILAKVLYTYDLPSNVNAASPVDVLMYVRSDLLGSDLMEVEAPRVLTLDTYPSASAIYRIQGTTGESAIVYLTVAIHNQDITLFLALCEEAVWPQYRYQLQSIVQSVDFTP